MSDTSRFIYTDRDYLSLRDQMVEYVRSVIPEWVPGTSGDGLQGDPSDFATVMIEAAAYMGDLLSYYVDRAAQEATPMTATSPNNVLAWANLFGYVPAMRRSASVVVDVSNPTDQIISVPHRLLLRSTTGYPFEIMLDPDEDGVVPNYVDIFPNTSKSLTAWEGTSLYTGTLRGMKLGVSSGAAGQEFPLDHTNIDSRDLWVDIYLETITGEITSGDWNFTYRLLDQGPEDQVFTVRTDSSGKLTLAFGDGTTGAIPPRGYTIWVYYRTCSGASANNPAEVPPYSISMVDSSWDNQSRASVSGIVVSNTSSPFGGVDPESLDMIRTNITRVASAQRRAVTENDWAAVALLDGEVLRADCVARVWSRPTVWVYPKSSTIYQRRDEREAFLTRVRETVNSMSMIGSNVDVLLGMPTPLNLSITVWLKKNVRQSAAVAALKNVISTQFAYENLKFREGISSEDILTAIASSSTGKYYRHIRPDLTAVYPTQLVENTNDEEADPWVTQRFLPRNGELLYVDPDNLTITVNGGINDLRT